MSSNCQLFRDSFHCLCIREFFRKVFHHVLIEFSVYINNSCLEATTNGKVYSEHLRNKSFIDFLDYHIPFHFRKQ